jgi:hypothetical protein
MLASLPNFLRPLGRYIVLTIAALLFHCSPALADMQSADAAYAAGRYETAFQQYQPLAAQGDAKAQGRLGWLYEYGKGTPKNEAQAVAWYRKSAEQGDAVGQFNLGVMYAHGRAFNYPHSGSGITENN